MSAISDLYGIYLEGNQIIHLIFTGMKTALLLLLLFLVNSGSAETFVPYTPDSLKKGDWVEIESVHYYPYIAPGIEIGRAHV